MNVQRKTERFARGFAEPRPRMTLIERAKQFAPFNLESAPEERDLAEHLATYAGKRNAPAAR
ncbi:MAG: hypothetical protein IJV00_05615 [Clostridia bacterium]|nr:hypothetical protein [Clostridia bacterium]